VLGNAPLDVDHCVESLEDQISRISSEKTIILLYEACYHYLSKRILDILQERNPSMILRYGQTPTFYDPSSETTTHSPANKENTMIVSVGSHKVENFPHEEGITAENSAFLYIGQESPHLTSMLMRFSTNDWYSYNPVTYSSRKEGALLNKSLMKRFFLVQKAKEAQIFGILLGTLGVAKYLDVVNNLQKLIKASGRKSYMFVVGKINVPKLANYAEIDAFVLVACHQNSLMDSKDFFKPIITPFELQLALSNSEEWTGQFKTDFHEVLQTIEDTTKSLENEDVDEEDADQPYFSLVSGTYKVAQSNKTKYSTFFSSEVEEKSDQAIQLKNLHADITAYRSEAGEFLATREYRGLEPRIGETQAHAAVLGSAGIARGYEHEQEESS
jgi:diphthamide biosynthesis protein 2